MCDGVNVVNVVLKGNDFKLFGGFGDGHTDRRTNGHWLL